MTLPAPERCSALADALAEPMAGTADHRERWLLVEDRSAWGEHAVRDVLGRELEAAAKERSMRLLLIRRRDATGTAEGNDGDGRVAFLVDLHGARIARRAVSDPAELLGLLDAPIEAFGGLVDGPMLLVCTNGRRDACCALRGRALVGALAADHEARTWECTHLGGHRFAGNLVCLPHGFIYGRVAPADGPRLADAYLRGEVDPDLLRGRSTWPEPAQVAEIALRATVGVSAIDAVSLRAIDRRGDAASVELDAGGRTHRFELVAERLDPARPISCRADKIEAPVHWRVVRTASGSD